MQIRLWGMVAVGTHGRIVQPPSGRARQLLACLAWQPRQFLLDEQLIEWIWGAELPMDPRDALYTCAKRLRQTIPDVLVRRRGGYLLDARPDQVDVHRFRELIRRARRAPHEPSAVSLFRQALRVPQGAPLADVDSPWAAGVRHVLLREQLSAQVAACAGTMRAGRPRDLVPELTYLAVQHPLAEDVARLLMEALHRSGERAYALAEYARIRGRLIEELGIEPGPELRATHRQVLLSTGREEVPETYPSGV